MGLSSLSLMLFSIYILSTIVKFHLVVANSLQSYTPTCSADEHSALLQFKQSFVINTSASSYYDDYGAAYLNGYPKTLSWKSNRSCCSWDGVTCDEETGHVIGLDLSGSCLYGSINSSSSLFRLVHLESLNLAYNDFNSSQIPPTIRNLPRLRYLNLSFSGFSGRVPSEISHLSKLSSLSIQRNYYDNQIFSHEGFLRSLAQNLTGLEKLHLSYINISSSIPDTLANMSHLTSLVLVNCILSGELPFSLGNLRHLFYLDLSLNNIFGQIHHSFGNLSQLTTLGLDFNQLSGHIPASFGNLTRLTQLWLDHNQLSGPILASFGNLSQLTAILLASNQLSGPIPPSFGNLSQLMTIWLNSNQLSGPIPASLGYLTQLTYLGLGGNNFNSSIPPSLFNLVNLRTLNLMDNNWSGTIEFHKFFKLQNLTELSLSGNKPEMLMGSTSMNNATIVVPKFEYLVLRGCNISEFPDFLRSQDSLMWLDLSGNRLHGRVPKWMWNTSTQTLTHLNLSHNFLSGFDQVPDVLPWVNMQYLDLSFNMLRGSLWIPSTSISIYAISNNNLTGQVPPLICNLTSLVYLDLSNNKLSGILPRCLKNFSYNLKYLNLGNNSFHGNLPEAYTNGGQLRMVDISHNNFHGQLPRSLTNCASLESLELSHNNFTDTFPIWLGDLPELKILTMNHNGFYGVIAKPKKKNHHFPVLRILYLSSNNFSGQFPFEYIFSGNGTTSTQDLKYYFTDWYIGDFSITIISKGVERFYSKIQEDMILIDISSNNFEGKIPEFIGKLSGIWSLNISNNNLTGSIPSSLSNLKRLESLDLSHNKLSGEIPQQLAKLDWLQIFNVSHNNLTGPVPRGTHFTTFDSTSYLGNPGLCGDILPKKCGNSKAPQPPPSPSTETEDDSGSGIEVDWKFALAGLGSGILVGVVLADILITKRPESFLMIVGICRTLMEAPRRP